MYDPQNVFAKIIRSEIPCDKVYEDELCLAFRDIHPEAPVHILLIPKAEITNLDDLTDDALATHLVRTARNIAANHGCRGAWRLQVNVGPRGGQIVPHLHVHIKGWPEGK